MPRDLRAYLFDILLACQRLDEFTGGKTFADYESEPMLRAAVERQFEIIGEALRQATTHHRELGLKFSFVPQIISFRNILIHGYASVANDIVWDILHTRIPVLRQEVEQLIATLEA